MPWDRKISMCQILNWIVYHCHYLTKQLFRAITVQTVTDVVRYSISPATIIGNSSNRSCRWGSPSSASLILCVSINSSQLWALWILSLSFNKIWIVLQIVWYVFPLDFHICIVFLILCYSSTIVHLFPAEELLSIQWAITLIYPLIFHRFSH